MAYTVFISYAHEDRGFLDGLRKHLSGLRRQGLISDWFDGDIVPGTDWQANITRHMYTDQIILLLISADFMDSDFCYSVEMKRAIERHDASEARVLPIMLRPTDYEGTPFSKLQMLPSSAKAISTWPNRDEAFIDVVKGIKRAIHDLQSHTP